MADQGCLTLTPQRVLCTATPSVYILILSIFSPLSDLYLFSLISNRYPDPIMSPFLSESLPLFLCVSLSTSLWVSGRLPSPRVFVVFSKNKVAVENLLPCLFQPLRAPRIPRVLLHPSASKLEA